jgi:hypothetical protein
MTKSVVVIFPFMCPWCLQTVQTSAKMLLQEYRSESFSVLPSGTSVYQLLQDIAGEEVDETEEGHASAVSNNNKGNQAFTYTILDKAGRRTNTLVRLLERISVEDWLVLHDVGLFTASSYRFYSLNSNMTAIPTSKHVFPDGGALQLLDFMLQRILQIGTGTVQSQCHVCFLGFCRRTVVNIGFASLCTPADRKNSKFP